MVLRLSTALVVLLVSQQAASAQGLFGNRNVGAGSITGSTNRTAGLSQTGTVTSEGAIQRTQEAFVGTTSQNASAIRSLAGQGTTGLGGRTSSLGGFGGVGGLGGFGGVGGLGGIGGIGGLGGFGGLGGYGMGGLGGRGGLNTFGQQGMNSQQQQRQIRAPLRLGFEAPVVGPTVIEQRLTNRIPNIPGFTNVNTVVVRTDGRTVVLEGAVKSERDREILGQLLLLEPGVDAVKNELRVDPTLADAEPSSDS